MVSRHLFSETAEIEQKNRSKGLSTRTIYIPNANLTGKDAIVVNNRIKPLHTHCRNPKCGVKLVGRIWQYLGICAICDMQ